ncbi:MAG: sigma-70 family RNA polymerase sigma factor [Pseudomonadota bacterium]
MTEQAINPRPDASNLSKFWRMDESKPKTDLAEEGRRAAALAERIRAGDRRAENELVARYSRPLMIMLRARTNGDLALAEDIHQDVFRIVIERLRGEGIDDPTRLGGYIQSTGKFQIIGRKRRQKRRNTHADSELIEETIAEDDEQMDSVYSDQMRIAVRDLLKELPNDRDRALLTRFYLYQESKASICAALELSDLHFNRVLYRAKARFRALLEKRAELDL